MEEVAFLEDPDLARGRNPCHRRCESCRSGLISIFAWCILVDLPRCGRGSPADTVSAAKNIACKEKKIEKHRTLDAFMRNVIRIFRKGRSSEEVVLFFWILSK